MSTPYLLTYVYKNFLFVFLEEVRLIFAGESEHVFCPMPENEPAAETEGPSEGQVMGPEPQPPGPEAYVSQPADSDAKISQAVADSTLQNSPVQYSAANYMPYTTQMNDPSLMPPNYPYMTAAGYADYVSTIYHTGRLPRQYQNAYAHYQNYNYPYPQMQQMYDGRSMAAFPPAGYSSQMLPPTPPLPRSHQLGHAPSKNFTPPLPSDHLAPSFSSEPPRAKKAQGRPNDKEINSSLLSESDLPPLPEDAVPERPKERASEDEQTHDDSFCASQPDDADTAEEDPDRMLTDSAGENASEDVNR